jgi:multidrug transporter EmrE-like cation transporter
VTQDIDRLLVRHLPRAEGRSNYTVRRLLRLWLSMFVNFSVMPLRISTLTGFVLSVGGAIGGLSAIIEALFFAPPAGWASLMAAVLLLSGVQLVILGIVGEYLGRLYLTANKKPQSIVKTVTRRTRGDGAARQSLRRASGRSGAPMAIYYSSLAARSCSGSSGDHSNRGRRLSDVVAQFANPLTIVGFAIYVFAALLYIVALKKIPVSVAFPSVAASYAAVAIIAHLMWNEPFGWPQLGGLVLIGSGILLIHQH